MKRVVLIKRATILALLFSLFLWSNVLPLTPVMASPATLPAKDLPAALPAASPAAIPSSPLPVTLETKVDKQEVTVGDPIQYSVIVSWAEGIDLTLPQLGDNLAEFEIQDYQIAEEPKKKGRLTKTITYLIAVYEVGTFSIPPLTVSYRQALGEKAELTSKPIQITVKATAPEDAAEIKDIKAPLEPKRNWKPYLRILFWLGMVILVILLIMVACWYYRKRKSEPLPEEMKDLRPAHEIAYEELRAIAALPDDDDEDGHLKEWYLRLSEIMRGYFSRRYQINALEATTEELLKELKNQPVQWQQRSTIMQFLNNCDLVKFAKFIPLKLEIERTYQEAFTIVEVTKKEADQKEPDRKEPDRKEPGQEHSLKEDQQRKGPGQGQQV